MYCCDLLADAEQRGTIYIGPVDRIRDGRITNDLDTEYFIRSASGVGYSYTGINYCPFCGRALAHGLWVAEKKK